MARQKLSQPEAYIPPPDSKAKRDRTWEQRQRTGELVTITYRRIPRSLRDTITATAHRHLIPVDDLARALLEYGLSALENGDLELRPRLKTDRYTLFSENGDEI